MNAIIHEYFNAIETCLLESRVVISYRIMQQTIAYNNGKIRLKATLSDGSMAELFEYVIISGETLEVSKYSFHWQDIKGKLKCRWDNAPHYPNLPNAPHHRHNSDTSVSHNHDIPDILQFMKHIQLILSSS